VALQDHFSRSLNLNSTGIPFIPKPTQKKDKPRNLPPLITTATTRSNTNANNKNKKTNVKKDTKKHKNTEDDFTVLNEKKYQLTLAQKMGLVESPPPPLTQTEWKDIKKLSETRKDSYLPCPICRDDFGTEGQVLLSCSHVFHKLCLASFEKYTKTTSCPVCRRGQYQMVQISEGKKVHMNKCATKIQAVFRGYQARKMIVPDDPHKRKMFYARKLEKVTDRLLEQIEYERAAIDSSLMSMDYSVAASIAYLRSVGVGSSMQSKPAIDWDEVRAKASGRGTQDCPICITALLNEVKKSVILSCSHIFHESCINSFENFNCENVHVCPVCRALYDRMLL